MFLACVLGALACSGCFGRKKSVDSLFSQPPIVGEAVTNAPAITVSTETKAIHEAPVTNTPVTNAIVQAAPVTNAIVQTAPVTNSPTTSITAKTNLIMTPAEGVVGKVARANLSLKYVVLSFPIGQMPADEQHLNVYRKGLKVGEVKVTGPKMDENTIADVVQGTAEVGDEVRAR